jgi:hypothetical protein
MVEAVRKINPINRTEKAIVFVFIASSWHSFPFSGE